MGPDIKGKVNFNSDKLTTQNKVRNRTNNGTCSQRSEFWSGEKIEGGDDHCADAESHYDRQVDYLEKNCQRS
jgi:hypothetical protein